MTKKSRYTAIKATATRALIPGEGQDFNRIEVTFHTKERPAEKITFELSFHESARLIEQLMASYNAIAPVLKTSRGGWGL